MAIIRREFFSVRNVPRQELNFLMDDDIKNDCLTILKRLVVSWAGVVCGGVVCV
jgi:hypothetical protein